MVWLEQGSSLLPPPRRKKARTGGEGDSYDPYDFSDAEEEMPEGESLGFCWLLRVLLPSALVGLHTLGSSSNALGSLGVPGAVWHHQIKMNLFFLNPPWPRGTGELVLLVIFLTAVEV